MRENYAYCEALVREADRDRYLAILFAPGGRVPLMGHFRRIEAVGDGSGSPSIAAELVHRNN